MSSYAKVSIKIPQIARWRLAGIKDTTIGQMLGMSSGGLARLLATEEYKEYEAALLNGHLSKMDEALAGRVNLIQKEFSAGVPAAVRCLLDTVTQRKDLKASLEAAKEILDRDPDRTLVKNKGEAFVAPGLSNEVLASLTEENNQLVDSMSNTQSAAPTSSSQASTKPPSEAPKPKVN